MQILTPAERLEAIEDSVQEMETKLDQLLDIMAGKKQEKMGVLTELAGDESSNDDFEEVRSRHKKRVKKFRQSRPHSLSASSA